MLNRSTLALGLVLLAKTTAAAQSSLYPTVDSSLLAKAFNISLGCLDILNTTVSCDGDLLRMAGTVDDFLWDVSNVTALCTADCQASTTKWLAGVQKACANDYINVNGRLVPPDTIPGRMVDGLNIACLTPTTNVALLPGVNGTEITSVTTIIANSTVTADTTIPTATSAPARRDALFEHPVAERTEFTPLEDRQSSSSGYCLIDSYNWVGRDIIRPDCPSGSTTPQCLDPTDVPDENQRIANLYPNSLLCSDCFLKMFYLRVASPYLPDLDFSDYLLTQYLDIVNVCQAKMPDLLVRMTPVYDYANGTWDGAPAYVEGAATPKPNVACAQNISTTDLQSLSVTDPNANGTIFCDAMTRKFKVATGDLQVAFGAPMCTPGADFAGVCVPAACTVMQIQYNTTCDSVISTLVSGGHNVTSTQLALWNPNLQGLCDSLMAQYICISAPGGSYVPPPASNNTSDDAGQTRGGGTGSSTGSGSAAGGGRNATVVAIGGQAPSPTQSGITPQCTEYAMASKGDGCYSLTQLWRIPESDFFAWNSILGTDGANCATQLFADYYYCIDIVRTATTSVGPTSTQVTAPGPTQTGIISTCNKFAKSIDGLGCADFAKAEGITPAQLYAWNTVLGANGANCGTALWKDEYYCVGVSGGSATTTSTPTSTGAVTAPGPTQSGIISTCNKYAKSIDGLGCADFAKAEGITPAQLYAWNTVLGANGANCGTALWKDEYYCVGVSGGSTPTTTSKATSTVPTGAPGPTQSGIISTCNKYAKSIDGLGCYDFAVAEGITPAQLYAWNTVLGANGANCGTALWKDEYYCVGVKS